MTLLEQLGKNLKDTAVTVLAIATLPFHVIHEAINKEADKVKPKSKEKEPEKNDSSKSV